MALTSEQLLALRSLPKGTALNKVRLARTLAELKQNELAEATGFTSPQLSDIERGEYKDIPLENSRRLAEFFGCRIEDIFPPREVESAPAGDEDRRQLADRRRGEDRRESL